MLKYKIKKSNGVQTRLTDPTTALSLSGEYTPLSLLVIHQMVKARLWVHNKPIEASKLQEITDVQSGF